MKVVLDTHAATWYLHSPAALSPDALRSIRKAVGNGRPVFVSAISRVEMIDLVERGRLLLEALRRLRETVNSKASRLLVQPGRGGCKSGAQHFTASCF